MSNMPIENRWYGGSAPQQGPDWAEAAVNRLIADHLAEHGEIRLGAITMTRKKPAEDAAMTRWYGYGNGSG